MEQQLFKLKVKFGGYFKKVKNSIRIKYYFGRQKSWFIDVDCYCYKDLFDDIVHTFNLNLEENIKIWSVVRHLSPKSYMILDTDHKLMSLFEEYKDLKECLLFVTRGVNDTQLSQSTLGSQDQFERQNQSESLTAVGIDTPIGAIENNDYVGINDETIFQEEQETDTEIYGSESSYHSIYNSDSDANDDDKNIIEYEGETYEIDNENPNMVIGAKYASREQFKVALSQYAILNEFTVRVLKSEPGRMTVTCKDETCNWRLHASLLCDGRTFQVKKLSEPHTCSSVNKCGNNMATQFWIRDRVIGWLRKEGDLSPIELRRRLLQLHHLELPYHRVWRGKELAMSLIHGNWADSFERMEDFKEELLRRNPDSIVKLKLDVVGDKHYFHRFFVCLRACSMGFLAGCRPFIGLDGCHLKGKFRGVMMAATALDGNNGLFPIAFGIAESENSDSWTWFLEALKELIGTPEGLVLISDRQKGLEEAVQQIYSHAEHRKCMRHLYKNFQTKFSGHWLKIKVWGAARAYKKVEHDDIMNQIKEASLEAFRYLNAENIGLWSRSQFGITAKCSYITNNLSESFNAWVSEARHRPVLDLLDVVRQKIMVKMEARRRMAARWKGNLVPVVMKYIRDISLKLGDYNIYRTSDYRAEVIETNGRYEVILNEQRCSCRLWEVSGIPCIHAAAFICSMRGAKLENYVSEYFTVAKYRAAYALEIGPLPDKAQWIKIDIGYKVLPPKLSLRPPGRPKKKRIRGIDENTLKKMHKCKRCGELGHHAKTCKNPVVEESQASISSSSAPKKSGRPKGNNSRERVSIIEGTHAVFVAPRGQKNKGRPRKQAKRMEASIGEDNSYPHP